MEENKTMGYELPTDTDVAAESLGPLEESGGEK